MTGIGVILRQIAEAGIPGDVWIDGSFVTEKIDPQDVDLLAVIPASVFENGTPQQQELIEWLIATEDDPKKSFHCDIDVYLRYPEDSPDYPLWERAFADKERIFGISVATQEPKGIILIDLEAVLG